jgi:hypothetical protein
MLVHVLNFGTNWWARFGQDPADPNRYSRNAVFYNSTGVRCGHKVRRRWLVSGLIRFNGVGEFNPHLPGRSIGETFICSDLTFACGGNRLLFGRVAPKTATPDRYLTVISSERYGRIDFASRVWKSALSSVIAASQLRDMQESMLLMKPGDWIQTRRGFWQLNVTDRQPKRAELESIGAPICA